jgi:heme A synthase
MKLDRFAKYAWFVLAFNLAVILWGAFVRASGSGAGCGAHWPLCNGEIVPLAPALQTIIEFVHRLSSGTAFLIVVGMVVWARRAYPAGHCVRAGAVASLGGMIAESLAGAGLVLFQWTAFDISLGRIIIMPTHLVITFTLLAALVLTAWWASGGAAVCWNGQGAMRWLLGIGLLATLVTGMAGAVTALGDTVLPVASLTPGHYETLSPAGQLLVALRVWHPLIAIGGGIYLLVLVTMLRAAHTDPWMRRLTGLLSIWVVLELGAGVLNIWLQVPIWMQLTHLWLANLLWITLILLSAVTLARKPGG